MSTLTEKIKALAIHFGIIEQEKVEAPQEVVETEVKFEDAKAEDGTILRITPMEVGAVVEVIQEDGTLVPAPDGTYKLTDLQKTITVVDGKLTEIVEDAPETEVPVAEEEMKKEEEIVEVKQESDTLAFAEKIFELENAVSQLYVIVAELVNKNNNSVSNQENINTAMSAIQAEIVELKKSPVTTNRVKKTNNNVAPKMWYDVLK